MYIDQQSYNFISINTIYSRFRLQLLILIVNNTDSTTFTNLTKTDEKLLNLLVVTSTVLIFF